MGYGSNDRRNPSNPQFQQQRADGGLLADALIQISGGMCLTGTTPGERIQSEEERQSRNRQDEENLEHFAKKQDAWIVDADGYLEELYGTHIAQGSESFVYLKSDTTLVKTRSFIGYETVLQALVSIKIHNDLFPETSMKIVAFGRSFDEFTAIIEQVNIDGNFATKEEIAEFVRVRFGAEKDTSVLGDNSYKTDRYLLQDLKPKNVLVKEVDGQNVYYVIDGDFYYNLNGN